MTRGLFISFEGIDGAGKSTHIDRVAQLFRQAGRTVVLTREPGGTPLSGKLRELVGWLEREKLIDNDLSTFDHAIILRFFDHSPGFHLALQQRF